MPVESTTKDIFSLEVDALVNPVNCIGVAGKGLAAEFKLLYPDNFRVYKKACDSGELRIGKVYWFRKTWDALEKELMIINFPTKDHWRYPSRMEYIEKGLEDLKRLIVQERIKTIAIPALGCGLGGLDWHKVKPLIVEAVGNLDGVTVYIIEPKD